MDRPSSTVSVVLAGGGCKTFWGMGVLEALDGLVPPVDHWAGTSAGAVMALVRVSERVDACYHHFLELVRDNQRNFYPRELLRRRPAFPHSQIFHRELRYIFADGGFARIRHGAPVHILMSYVVGRRPLLRGLSAAVAFERHSRSDRIHSPAQPPPGVRARVVRSIDAMDPEHLSDWVAASASTPPVTPMIRGGGRRYLDGALVDNIPVRALPDEARRGRVLVLLSGPKPVAPAPQRLPEGGAILYLAPAGELPVTTWDYTSPERVIATYELGQREGAAARARVEALLGSPPG